MSFLEKAVPLGTSDTDVYECPATFSGSVHGLVFSNTTAGAITIALKHFSQATGTTTTIISALSIAANTPYAWPKPINMVAGDKIIASASSTSSIVVLASVYLGATSATIGITPRGAWNSSATYLPNELVYSAGTSYICVTTNTNDVPPSANWMISASKGDAGPALQVLDEGSSLTSTATSINFVGGAVTATNIGGAVTVTIPSPATITAKDEGSTLTAALTSLDFVGAGVAATNTGGAVTVSITSPTITAKDEGTNLTTALTSLDFVGTGVTATNTGGAVTITIAGNPANTDSLTEGSTNLYFTNARSIASPLAGFSNATSTAITSSDSIVVGIGKAQGQLTANLSTLTSHTGNTSNPHSTTASQVGLGNVTNTSDANKPVSTAQQTALDLKLNLSGGTITGALNTTKATDIASAGTLDLTPAAGRYVSVTGTTTVTAITLASGSTCTVRFGGALILTHGSSLVLPGLANITTSAGDIAKFVGDASSIVYCVSYTKADGTPVVGGGGAGAMVYLGGTTAATAVSSIDIEDIFTTTYDRYLICYTNIHPSTDAQDLYMQFKISGSYQTSSYENHVSVQSSAVSTYSGANAPGSAFKLADAVSNTSTRGADIDFHLTQPADTVMWKRCWFQGLASAGGGATSIKNASGYGHWVGTPAALTGLRLKFASGNITGIVRVYGIKNS